MADSSQQDSLHPGEPGEAAIDIISGLEELQVATAIAEEDMEPTPQEFQNHNDDTPSDVEDDPPPAAPPSAPPLAGSGGGGTSAPVKEAKYQWEFAAQLASTPRAVWQDHELPQISPAFEHLTWESQPHEFFQVMDASDREYSERAANSELYRSHRQFHELDGRNQNNYTVKSYDGAAAMKYSDMRYLDASGLLNGLDPAVSRDLMFENDHLAVKGPRVSDLFERKRYFMVRKFHHPTDPKKTIPRGQQSYDNLFQVSNMLQSLQTRSSAAVEGGKHHSVDEETLGFQGAHAELKLNSGSDKAAGDGLQCDAACCEGDGFLQIGVHIPWAFSITQSLHQRAATRETVSSPSKVRSLSCPFSMHEHVCNFVHRIIYCLYLSKCTSGSDEVGMDNLYNSVDFAHLLEKGATFVIERPTLPTRQAEVVEWTVSGVHTIDTLQGGRGTASIQGEDDSGTRGGAGHDGVHLLQEWPSNDRHDPHSCRVRDEATQEVRLGDEASHSERSGDH